MVARGVLEYWRTMAAHPHRRLWRSSRSGRASSTRLRPSARASSAGERSGDVLLTLIDGVEQLETYFGQYLPQLVVAALTPFGIFVFAAFLDLPLAGRAARLRAAHPRRARWPSTTGTSKSAKAQAGRPMRPTAPNSSIPCRGWRRSRPSARAVRAGASWPRRPTTSSAARCGCWRATPRPVASPMPASRSAPQWRWAWARPASPRVSSGSRCCSSC